MNGLYPITFTFPENPMITKNKNIRKAGNNMTKKNVSTSEKEKNLKRIIKREYNFNFYRSLMSSSTPSRSQVKLYKHNTDGMSITEVE